MVIAGEFGSGQVLWSLLWFFLFFLWLWLIITIFADIIRSDMSGWAKAGWAVVIIIIPILGALIYLIFNGNKMSDRAAAASRQQDEAFQQYVRQAAGGTSTADQLARLAELHDAGSISDAEYESAKAKALDG
ncbi:MAG: SHOCT domain-containing protein [Acidimicrobiia bacterium]|nr:SHOCT domain-containing protein [Acidimicrobiia bacterium]